MVARPSSEGARCHSRGTRAGLRSPLAPAAHRRAGAKRAPSGRASNSLVPGSVPPLLPRQRGRRQSRGARTLARAPRARAWPRRRWLTRACSCQRTACSNRPVVGFWRPASLPQRERSALFVAAEARAVSRREDEDLVSVLVGFDPGGVNAFGWCVARDSSQLPLAPLATGIASNARAAVAAALAAVPNGEVVAAAGIDAPLLWARSGPRNSDRIVRQAIARAGAPHPAGTVQDINSLRGACLAQGILAALELRDAVSLLPLTEAHPKALRWLCPHAAAVAAPSEHERDAVLAAFTAWALVHKPPDWCDLYAEEVPSYTPLASPLSYFMPRHAG